MAVNFPIWLWSYICWHWTFIDGYDLIYACCEVSFIAMILNMLYIGREHMNICQYVNICEHMCVVLYKYTLLYWTGHSFCCVEYDPHGTRLSVQGGSSCDASTRHSPHSACGPLIDTVFFFPSMFCFLFFCSRVYTSGWRLITYWWKFLIKNSENVWYVIVITQWFTVIFVCALWSVIEICLDIDDKLAIADSKRCVRVAQRRCRLCWWREMKMDRKGWRGMA